MVVYVEGMKGYQDRLVSPQTLSLACSLVFTEQRSLMYVVRVGGKRRILVIIVALKEFTTCVRMRPYILTHLTVDAGAAKGGLNMVRLV